MSGQASNGPSRLVRVPLRIRHDIIWCENEEPPRPRARQDGRLADVVAHPLPSGTKRLRQVTPEVPAAPCGVSEPRSGLGTVGDSSPLSVQASGCVLKRMRRMRRREMLPGASREWHRALKVLKATLGCASDTALERRAAPCDSRAQAATVQRETWAVRRTPASPAGRCGCHAQGPPSRSTAWGMSWGMNHGVPPPPQQVEKDFVKAELPGDGHSR